MDGLSVLSPASRERSLDDLPRKELQQLAKEAGVKGNIKSKDIVQSLLRCLEGQEAVPGTVKKARPAPCADALARADTEDSLGAESNPSDNGKQLDAAMNAAAQQQAEPDSMQDQLQPAASNLLADIHSAPSDVLHSPALEDASAADDLKPAADLRSDHTAKMDAAESIAQAAASGESTQAEQPADPQLSDRVSAPPQSPAMTAAAAPAQSADTGNAPEQIQAGPASSRGADTKLASTPALAAIDSGRTALAGKPSTELASAAADAVDASSEVAVGGDCVSNPLYEEPEDLRPVPQAAAPSSLLSQRAQGDKAAAAILQAGEGAAGPSAPEPQLQQEVQGSCNQDTDMGCADEGDAAQQPTDSQSDHASPASEADGQQHGQPAVLQDSKEMSVCDVAMSEAGGKQHGREPTPEGLANLGKAVDLVQAQSCQLSPSLLTVGQAPPGLESPARDAFERGRKSGIWQGSTEVELRQLERQWDDYKSVATRGWDLPNLQEVQAKSDALEASGFATVHSPLVSKATKQAIAKQVSKGGKRKARGEEGEEAPAGSKQAGPSRKAVKRAQGHTPSRKGPAPSHKGSSPGPQSHGTPLRHVNGARAAAGPSRLANSTHAADLENAAKAANSTPATQGGEGKVQGSPFCAGVTNRDTNAGLRASKATGIPKPRPANDRAKKAEATFAARRAAALAKVKK